ncbi:MAG: hypothetical protein JSS81_23675 [Acidobacteria bacterium]|nr:hypothetical protein [Acidobacteriota bacterium]
MIERELPFRVILPENYETSKADYPVLYLLHGLFGACDNWLELTAIEDYLAGQELIVVLPDGGDKWYSDSATRPRDKFESSFINEFMPAVEARWRIVRKRAARAVAGLSMGGYGALKFALKRPDLFAFAGSMSGAFLAPRLTAENRPADQEDLLPSIAEVFGAAGHPARIENDLFGIVGKMSPAALAAAPSIYLDCGTDDGFLAVNRELAALLEEKGLRFEYHEIPGGHDWNYWDARLRTVLEKVFETINHTEKSEPKLKLHLK